MSVGPTQPLRILHVGSAADYGGVPTYVLDLTTELVRRGHAAAFAARAGPLTPRFQHAGVEWLDVPLRCRPWALAAARRQLQHWAAAHRPHLIHAHFRRATRVARPVARALRIPLLYTLHLPGFATGVPHRWFSDYGDHAHAVSAAAARWFLDHTATPPSRVTVIPHGVDTRRFRAATAADRAAARHALGLPPHAPVAAFVGRLDPQKNPHWLLDVLRAAGGQGLPLHLVIQGTGTLEPQLRSAAADLTDRIAWRPWGDPLATYDACDLLLLPARQEGFGLVVAEAMAVGRAVVRTQTPGAAEQVIEGVTGVTCPVGRDAFVAATLTLLRRGDLAQVGAAAAAHARAHLRYDQQVDRTIDLYRQLVGAVP